MPLKDNFSYMQLIVSKQARKHFFLQIEVYFVTSSVTRFNLNWNTTCYPNDAKQDHTAAYIQIKEGSGQG